MSKKESYTLRKSFFLGCALLIEMRIGMAVPAELS